MLHVILEFFIKFVNLIVNKHITRYLYVYVDINKYIERKIMEL